jgi:2-methylcitrate dehydratase
MTYFHVVSVDELGVTNMRKITEDLLRFVTKAKYEDLPDEVVHEAKRSMLDALGCAVAGIATDKGKIAASIARRLGGTDESTIVGLGGKVSCSNAAMANGELINALDYDGISHVHPFAIPPALAMAESVRSSGKGLILASVLAQEVTKRFTLALMSLVAKLTEEARTPDVFGNSNEAIFGATVGASKILSLESNELAHALGIAAYLCPLPVCKDWEETVPKSMIKYVPVGWVCQGAVTATLLAQSGFTGNPRVFDGDYGFWRFYGAERWSPDVIVDGLGTKWHFMEMAYKSYPCCRFFHGQLDAFIQIIEENKLLPDDIERVDSYSLPFVASPAPYDVQTQVDVQFSLPFAFSAAAHRIRVGADWQDHDTIQDPGVRAFMKKVFMHVDPKAAEMKRKDTKSWPAKVEVKAKGMTYAKETRYPRGTNFTDFRATDDELIAKFAHNASRLLTPEKTHRAAEQIMSLDRVPDVTKVVSLLTV